MESIRGWWSPMPVHCGGAIQPTAGVAKMATGAHFKQPKLGLHLVNRSLRHPGHYPGIGSVSMTEIHKRVEGKPPFGVQVYSKYFRRFAPVIGRLRVGFIKLLSANHKPARPGQEKITA